VSVAKNLALALLSFLLFLSLTLFGITFMLNRTALNADFIVAEIDSLDVSSLMEEFIEQQSPGEGLPEEFESTILDTIDRIESPVKEEVGNAVRSVYQYLLGKQEQPELAATLRDTFFSSDFIATILNELDLAQLTEQAFLEQIGSMSEEFQTMLISTITEFEPQIKQRVVAASDPVFDYLVGETESIDLALILRNDVLTSEFVVALVEEIDLSPLLSEFIGEQLGGQLPAEMAFLADQLDELVPELEPLIKDELTASADDVLDYLLGLSPSLTVEISTQPLLESLEGPIKEALLEQLPVELLGLSQSEIDELFEALFTAFTRGLPATIALDESTLPIGGEMAEGIADAEQTLSEVRQDILEGIADVEDVLTQARPYIGYFQLGYNILIVAIVMIILGIILISREVKYITRSLGITFATYGALEYGGIFLVRYFRGTRLWLPDEITPALQTRMYQFMDNFISPLEILSLGLLIGGVALIVVSFVYRRGDSE
jgi:hypothetical protein